MERPFLTNLSIVDENKRIFEAWGSVEVKDKQGEIIPIEELEKIMPIVMDRGGILLDEHSNRPIGKILSYAIREHPETKQKGIYVLGKIFSDYELDDKVWAEIKEGKRAGLSFGGRGKAKGYTLSFGEPAKVIGDIEGYEFSVVEKPANPYAVIEWVNELAKSENGADIQKRVEKIGDKWCVVHCHGEDAGKPIKCFDTKEEAEAMHRAIMANKSEEEMANKDERPPKSWWDRCIARAQKWADDPQKVCGALWYNPELFIGGEAMRDSYGKTNKGEVVDVSKDKVEKQEEPKEVPAVDNEIDTLKKIVAELQNRVAGIETKLQEIDQKLAPAEAVAESENKKMSEKIENVEKKIEEITKGLEKISIVTTPRAELSKAETEEKDNDAMKIIHKLRKGEKVTLLDLKKAEAEKTAKMFKR